MNEFDEQVERIKAVFKTSKPPVVTDSTLRKYFKYLKANLICPSILTGIESIGYFGWEERFAFGFGSKRTYKRLRKERGSLNDEYELRTLASASVKKDWDIIVNVERITDRKQFKIPLSELEAADEKSDTHKLLNDYTVWFVNWR